MLKVILENQFSEIDFLNYCILICLFVFDGIVENNVPEGDILNQATDILGGLFGKK